MSVTWAISKREIRTYFNSPVAYIVVTAYMLIAGWLFFSRLFLEGQADLREYFGLTPWLFSFIVPAITMRLLAEEKGSGTIELLITLPVKDSQVVIGKFLAAVALIATIVGTTIFYAFTINTLGDLDRGPTIGGYLGMLLIGSAYAAVGVMASSFTKNQIVAFIVSFGLCFMLFMCGFFAPFLPQWLQPLLTFLSSGEHFNAIARGVIDTRDLVYFFSIITVCLVIATLSLESRRWS